jgi:hypothetical protein
MYLAPRTLCLNRVSVVGPRIVRERFVTPTLTVLLLRLRIVPTDPPLRFTFSAGVSPEDPKYGRAVILGQTELFHVHG